MVVEGTGSFTIELQVLSTTHYAGQSGHSRPGVVEEAIGDERVIYQVALQVFKAGEFEIIMTLQSVVCEFLLDGNGAGLRWVLVIPPPSPNMKIDPITGSIPNRCHLSLSYISSLPQEGRNEDMGIIGSSCVFIVHQKLNSPIYNEMKMYF
ncbi:unnamed protein product [Lactuca saligna]|uniref:Uncharacterized protein n=1 Tax=Lactuca saligna TaxID=75948 RepID=A0AA35ZW83_LACSI|nr:unnamed protein product [Lactuca saligna]